jgi:hypothetical protein
VRGRGAPGWPCRGWVVSRLAACQGLAGGALLSAGGWRGRRGDRGLASWLVARRIPVHELMYRPSDQGCSSEAGRVFQAPVAYAYPLGWLPLRNPMARPARYRHIRALLARAPLPSAFALTLQLRDRAERALGTTDYLREPVDTSCQSFCSKTRLATRRRGRTLRSVGLPERHQPVSSEIQARGR